MMNLSAAVLLCSGCFGALATVAIVSYVARSTAEQIYTQAEDVPAHAVAIVFGAGVWPNGRLSDVLAERVSTAVDLYEAGNVRKLLMTGDNRFEWYNEPGAMGAYAMELGVPAQDIIYDYAGRRTYDSCYRERYLFGIQDAVLVTQAYHLPRAIYTCGRMGMSVVGVAADRRPYQYATQFRLRELPATLLAWWQTHVSWPKPVMGAPIPISLE